jgi:hypothetical protein
LFVHEWVAAKFFVPSVQLVREVSCRLPIGELFNYVSQYIVNVTYSGQG